MLSASMLWLFDLHMMACLGEFQGSDPVAPLFQRRGPGRKPACMGTTLPPKLRLRQAVILRKLCGHRQATVNTTPLLQWSTALPAKHLVSSSHLSSAPAHGRPAAWCCQPNSAGKECQRGAASSSAR